MEMFGHKLFFEKTRDKIAIAKKSAENNTCPSCHECPYKTVNGPCVGSYLQNELNRKKQGSGSSEFLYKALYKEYMKNMFFQEEMEL